MNWFQRFFSNPNVHALASAATGAAAIMFPQYQLPLTVVASTLATTAAAIPENPVLVSMPMAPPITLPPAAAGGSYHAVDYATLAAALVQQFASTQQAPK